MLDGARSFRYLVQQHSLSNVTRIYIAMKVTMWRQVISYMLACGESIFSRRRDHWKQYYSWCVFEINTYFCYGGHTWTRGWTGEEGALTFNSIARAVDTIPMQNKGMFILHSQRRDCCWPHDAGSQVTSKVHGTDIVLGVYSFLE